MKSKRLTSLFGALITVVFLWIFFRKIEWSPLWQCFREARWVYVWPAMGLTITGMFLRAWRWEVLVRPIKKVPFFDVVSITFIGFMANSILPARAGEIIKPLALSHKHKMPFVSCFGTVVVERIMDILGTALLAIVVLLSLSKIVEADADYFTTLERSARVGGVVAVVCLLGLVLLVSFPRPARRIVEAMTSLLPRKWQERVLYLFESFEKGFHSLRDVRQAIIVSVLTLVLWANYTAVYYVLGFALGIPMTVLGACFIIVVLCVAVAVPQAPGFLGVFQVAARWACCDVLGATVSAANSRK